MSNYTTERKQALTSELWGLFVRVLLNAAELDSSYKHCKVSQNFHINKKSALKSLICL